MDSITDKTGRKVEEFAYGTYEELLTEVVNNIRFLYNGSYGVVTDSNGLYYMRARYYNPDIKRFINQDIKVGDISNGQGLNRYAYCEGNPVSMVDPFGLCGENANEQGEASKYQWLHNALDIAGLAFDAADVINAGVYALEGKWGQAAVSLACALPAIGTAIAGVSKATKFAKAGNIIGQTMKYAGKAYMTVQTATQALEMAGDAKVQYAVNGGKVTPDMALNIAGAAAMGALAVMSAGSMMKEVTSLAKASGIKMETTVRDVADSISGKTKGSDNVFSVSTSSKTTSGGADFFVGSEGVAKNLNEYDSFINRSGEADLFLPDEYYQKLDDNIANAIAARDAEVARIQSLSKTKQSNYTTVVGGVDIRTGDIFVSSKNSKVYSRNATCAEDIVFRGLGGNQNANIIMTPAVRPRTGEIIPVCERCQTKYPVNQFVKGTRFKK